MTTLNPLWARLDTIAAQASRKQNADPAHDILHVRRVSRTACLLAQSENANENVTACAALLHELFSYPKNDVRSPLSGEECARRARLVLQSEGMDTAEQDAVAYAISVHPFSRGILPETLEGRILQDADRLDAIGAVGIARCFSSGAAMGRPFYNETDPFCHTRPPDDKEWTLDHFYRKLLRLESGFHTYTARAVARERTAFLHQFLTQFSDEIGER